MGDRRPGSDASGTSVSRRALLSATGLAAGATVLSAAGAPAAAAPAGTGGAATADLPLIGGAEFPIGIYWPPPPYETTLARYREIRDAGFTFLVTGNYLADSYIVDHALGIADQAGLRVIVAPDEPRLNAAGHVYAITDSGGTDGAVSRDQARFAVAQAVDQYAQHPSLAGFSAADEPPESTFGSVARSFDLYRELAPDHLPYSNLVPGNGDGYSAFVQRYVDTTRPALLSFDRYPINHDGEIPGYFDNWARVRAIALAAGIPAWTYILSVEHLDYVFPTAAQLRWQINVSLAYGCKGIQYFTYWTPDPARGESFVRAVMTLDGQRTPLYEAARTINTGWLQPVGRQLKPLVSESVQHANDDPLPAGATAFRPGPYLHAVDGGPVVLGLFRAAPDDGRRWLLVTNRSFDDDVPVTVTPTADTVGSVSLFDPAGGGYATQHSPVELRLSAGSAHLLRLDP